MNSTVKYKGYIGSVEFSEEDMCFFGSVQGIRSLISYEGKDAYELIEDSFNVRVPAELHREAVLYALNNNMSLNKVVEEALRKMMENKSYNYGGALISEEPTIYKYGEK